MLKISFIVKDSNEEYQPNEDTHRVRRGLGGNTELLHPFSVESRPITISAH